MNYKALRSARIAVASLSLLLIALAFFDFLELMPDKLIKGSVWLQFVPSVLLFSKVFTLSSLGFAVVLLLTLLFGRVYCSAFCPLGILQDVILRIAKRFKKIRFKHQKAFSWVRNFLLLFTIITILSGTTLILNLLDPYSLFGRIFSDLFRPILMLINNGMASVFERIEVYTFYDVDIKLLNWVLYLTPVMFLYLIIHLTITHGRLYCNTICPVGTLLGYLSRYGLYKISINPSACTDCKMCERDCKAECIDLESQKVDNSRCISCFNCLTSCKFSAIDYTSAKGAPAGRPEKTPGQEVDTSRRKALGVLFGTALFPSGALAQEVEVEPDTATVPVVRKQYVTPPGSGDVQEFLTKCTACHLCVSACPTQVIQPSRNEFGWKHLMQVRMDFHTGFCNYECTRCTEICPTGALTSLPLEDKKLTQLGKAKFVEDNCIVKTEGTDCGACSEHCPTKAVSMVPYEGSLKIPEMDDSICIGCGACEYACPTTPYKAIYVKGNAVHVLADKPKEEKAKKTEFEGDFPF
jgi:ferredoxin